MSKDLEFVAVGLPPEVKTRLDAISKEILEMLKAKAKSPEEQLMVVDQVTRTLIKTYNMFIVSPIPEGSIGHT